MNKKAREFTSGMENRKKQNKAMGDDGRVL